MWLCPSVLLVSISRIWKFIVLLLSIMKKSAQRSYYSTVRDHFFPCSSWWNTKHMYCIQIYPVWLKANGTALWPRSPSQRSYLLVADLNTAPCCYVPTTSCHVITKDYRAAVWEWTPDKGIGVSEPVFVSVTWKQLLEHQNFTVILHNKCHMALDICFLHVKWTKKCMNHKQHCHYLIFIRVVW